MTSFIFSRIKKTVILLFFLVASGVFALKPVSAAGVILVTTTQDVYGGSACSLRNAVHAANTNLTFGGCPAGNVIQLSAGNYKLTVLNPNNTETDESAGDLDINANITITGTGLSSTVISSAGKAFGDRIFHVKSGSVTIQKMKITGGYVIHKLGAGILNDGGYLNLLSIDLDGNTVDLSDTGAGGGIANTSGQLLIDSSTISNNQAKIGGGIYNIAQLTVDHSAIYKNIAVDSGGGLDTRNPVGAIALASITNTTIAYNSSNTINSGGGISSASPLSITSSTIADNSGGGLTIFGESPDIQNTILARNLRPNCGIGNNIGLINVKSLGHNLVDIIDQSKSSECSFNGPGDILNQDAMLTPTMSSHAGAPLTYGFIETTVVSPAIDALQPGDPSCPADDQRGFVRPVDGNGDGIATCDIGAYEEREIFYINLPVITR